MAELELHQFVLKVHSRCNLACDYCYVYESVDQSWQQQPLTISDEVVDRLGRRLVEYTADGGRDRLEVTLHGGEPLLVGRDRLRWIITSLRKHLLPAALDVGIQTNGVLLSRSTAEMLAAEGVRVGISLDGGRAANDRHRRFTHGASSYDQVVRAVALMNEPAFRPLFAGLLVTVDVRNDPAELFRDLEALDPHRFNLLLPHATWDAPPPGSTPQGSPYGAWLAELFDAWFDSGSTTEVVFFEDLLTAMLGGASRSDLVGLSLPATLVVETDGSYQLNDALKVTYDGAPELGMTVFSSSVAEVASAPAVAALGAGVDGLSEQCRQCPLVEACGGGFLAHRYRSGNGFDNPSVYCRDLAHLIRHVGARMAPEFAATRPDLADRLAGYAATEPPAPPPAAVRPPR